MSTLQNLTTDSFDAAVDQGVSLVDFYADWCGPCKALAPVVEELAERHAGAATVAKVDVDANSELAARFNVRSIPTIVALKDGIEVDRITGSAPLSELENLLERAK